MMKTDIAKPKDLLNIITDLSDTQIQQLMLEFEQQKKPQKIVITDEEQEKIEEILNVFRDYIDGHQYFDIIHSKKYGYCRLDIDGKNLQLSTAEETMACIINEFYLDVRETQIGGPHMSSIIRREEENELRKRITPYIEKLNNSPYYLDILEAYINQHKI